MPPRVRVLASRLPTNMDGAWLESGLALLSSDDRSRFDAIPSRLRGHEFLLGRALLGLSLVAKHSAVSVSHSLGRVAVAVSGAGGVGIDLEVVRRHPEAVARRWLSVDEYGWFDHFGGSARRTSFFQLFTMKEAFSKACGTPLWRAPEVPLPVSDPKRVSTSVGYVTWGRLQVFPDAAAALCVRSDRDIAIDVAWVEPSEALCRT